MAAQPFNSIGGFSTGIPEVVIVDSSGNVVTNVLTSGNVAATTVYAGSYKLANGVSLTHNNSLVVSKNSGTGLYVDYTSPTFGWRDLLGSVTIEETGGPNRPTFTVYRDTIKQHRFAVGNQIFIEFHIPHDYATGTDMFIHSHWSHNAATVSSGGVTWGFEMSYSKGYAQAPFSASVSTTITQAASTTQYMHMVAETQITGNSLIPVASVEPDGIILTRAYLSATDMSDGALPFLHYVDIHYQSTGMGTKQKNGPAFYT